MRTPVGSGPGHTILGRHITIECCDCDEHLLNDVGRLEEVCLDVVRASGATIVNSFFHSFPPQCISGVVVISESHFNIHSWPEHRYAACDFFTCSDTIDFDAAMGRLRDRLRTDSVICSAGLVRGVVGNNGVERHIPVCENSRLTYSLSWRERYEAANAWGLLTSIDVHECDPALIRSEDHIRRYVVDLCERIEMRRFGDMVVVHFGEDERVAGFSMTQLIETSLVSGHFANASNATYIDIFSCKYYEPREAAEFTLAAFGGDHYQMQVALRT